MKISIKSSPSLITGNIFWTVKTPKGETSYPNHVAAFFYVNKYLKRNCREPAAYSKVLHLALNTLSNKEIEFVYGLLATKCKGITPKQYGYLAGIYERQQREW